MSYLTEVGAISTLAEILSGFKKIEQLDIKHTRAFIDNNKALLTHTGLCPFDKADSGIIGHPYWLYPELNYLSEKEFRQVNRAVILELRTAVMDLLEDIKNPNWFSSFLGCLRGSAEIKAASKFYLNADRVYAVKSILKSNSLDTMRGNILNYGNKIQPIQHEDGTPGCSGGLSDIIEMVYPFYEFYHFDWKEKLQEMFGGNLPTFDNIHHLKELYQRHEQHDELHDLLSSHQGQNLAFKKGFERSVSRALAGQDAGSQNKNETAFHFYHQICHELQHKPFHHSPDYAWIRFGGEEFYLSADQASIIKLLHETFLADGTRYLSQKEIAFALYADDGEKIVKFRMDDKFRDKAAQKLLGVERAYKPVFYRLIDKKEKVSEDGDGKANLYRLRLAS